MDVHDKRSRELFYAAVTASLLLAVLCVLGRVTHVTQQRFEFALPPVEYAAALVRDAFWLRVDITLDDGFIASYVTVAVLFAVRLAPGDGKLGPLHVLMIAASAAGGVLDLEENHHILGMLRLAEAGEAIPLADILHRTDLSQLKWMLGHVAFVLGGVALRPRDSFERAFRASLVFVQLPIGALAWTVTEPGWAAGLLWARYASFLAGFMTIAWLSRPAAGASRAAVVVAGSGAPA
jgi:hypothetical protein